jgi:hypothetical protein
VGGVRCAVRGVGPTGRIELVDHARATAHRRIDARTDKRIIDIIDIIEAAGPCATSWEGPLRARKPR